MQDAGRTQNAMCVLANQTNRRAERAFWKFSSRYNILPDGECQTKWTSCTNGANPVSAAEVRVKGDSLRSHGGRDSQKAPNKRKRRPSQIKPTRLQWFQTSPPWCCMWDGFLTPDPFWLLNDSHASEPGSRKEADTVAGLWNMPQRPVTWDLHLESQHSGKEQRPAWAVAAMLHVVHRQSACMFQHKRLLVRT